MKVTKDKITGKWKFLVPPKLTGTGKREYRSYDSKADAEAKEQQIRQQGPTKAEVPDDERALLALIKKQFGDNAAELISSLNFAKRARGGIPEEKRVDLETACGALIDRQITEQRNRRTVWSDRQALSYFCQFVGGNSPERIKPSPAHLIQKIANGGYDRGGIARAILSKS